MRATSGESDALELEQAGEFSRPALAARFAHALFRKNSSTSARNGIEAAAPLRVTQIAAAALANRAAAQGSLPSRSATANAPLKQSPAATVSMASTLNGRTHSAFPPAVATNAPSA